MTNQLKECLDHISAVTQTFMTKTKAYITHIEERKEESEEVLISIVHHDAAVSNQIIQQTTDDNLID